MPEETEHQRYKRQLLEEAKQKVKAEKSPPPKDAIPDNRPPKKEK